MSAPNDDFLSKSSLRLIGMPHCPRHHRCADRRGFCRRSRASFRARSAAPTRLSRTGAASSTGRRGDHHLPARAASSAMAPPPGCAISAWRPRILEGGFEAWQTAGYPLLQPSRAPAARCQGPHRLGHPRAAEDRPHRLPLADPPLRRSATRSSSSWRRSRSRWSASASAPRPSISRTRSGAIAASNAPSIR